jgi:hypothetical protein
MLYDNKYFQIDLFFTMQEFKNMIEQIIEPIHTKIKKNFASLIENKTYNEPIINNTNNTYKLRAKNLNIESITVYNYQKKKIDIRNIQRNDQIKAIIQLERLIIDVESYYFTFKIIQIKKNCHTDFFSPDINCLIQEDEAVIPSNTKFDKFTKMLKIGVPMQGVLQKMQLEALPESDIQYFSQLQNKLKTGLQPSINISITPSLYPNPILPPPPPPLPPPPPPYQPKLSTFINKNKDQLAFLADIKNGQFTLKKAIITDNTSKNEKILKYVDKTKHSVPSLEDILNAKSKLKCMKNLI